MALPCQEEREEFIALPLTPGSFPFYALCSVGKRDIVLCVGSYVRGLCVLVYVKTVGINYSVSLHFSSY